MRVNTLACGVTVVTTVEPPTVTVVTTDENDIVVGEATGEGGKTRVQGGEH